jgi:hypothetical protein
VFEFIESAAFDCVRARYLDDDEYRELQQFLMLNPEAARSFAARVVSGNSAGGAKAQASAGGCG